MEKNKTKNFFVALLLLFVFVLATVLILENTSYKGKLGTTLVKKYYGNNFQCVAFVQRYYQNMFDIDVENFGNAQSLFSKAKNFDLHAHVNGGQVYPQPGDILVFGHSNKIGHVAIITDVNENGVNIVEQNWEGKAITTNGDLPLPAIYENGKYRIENRGSFYVIGWVSRTARNPEKTFYFENSDLGWIAEENLLKQKKDEAGLELKITGRNPNLLSPIFLFDRKIISPERIDLRMKIDNESSLGNRGKISLRDQNGNWSELVEFSVSPNVGFRVYSVPLENLPENFQLTQIRLILNDNPQIGKETWYLNWIQVL